MKFLNSFFMRKLKISKITETVINCYIVKKEKAICIQH